MSEGGVREEYDRGTCGVLPMDAVVGNMWCVDLECVWGIGRCCRQRGIGSNPMDVDRVKSKVSPARGGYGYYREHRRASQSGVAERRRACYYHSVKSRALQSSAAPCRPGLLGSGLSIARALSEAAVRFGSTSASFSVRTGSHLSVVVAAPFSAAASPSSSSSSSSSSLSKASCT